MSVDLINHKIIDRPINLCFLGDHDMPCPLQLACRCTLTTTIGREIAKYLIRHGANVNYQDHALRNALYWAVRKLRFIYNNNNNKIAKFS